MAENSPSPINEKRLTPEELERHVERVTMPIRQVEIRDPFEVCPTKRIPAEDLAKMIDRVYTQGLQHKQERLAEADHPPGGASGRAVSALSVEDQELSVKRLYDETLERKQANMEKLRQQHLFHRSTEEKRVALKTFVQHMYYDRLEAKKKTEKRLYDTYLAPTEIKTGTISRAQADEASNRLCTSKSMA